MWSTSTILSNPDLEACVRRHFDHVTDAHLKLADTPAGTVVGPFLHLYALPTGMTEMVDYTLPDGRPSPFPLVICGGNIYILPGVPHLLQQKYKVWHTWRL